MLLDDAGRRHAVGPLRGQDVTAPFESAFAPFDDAFRRDPFAVYARARREHPVYAHPNFPAVSADCLRFILLCFYLNSPQFILSL